MLAFYIAAMPSRLALTGGAITGKMRRRTITMGAPQQVHSSWGRDLAGLGALGGGLNTSNFNSEIKRLLFGCKNPKLRARL